MKEFGSDFHWIEDYKRGVSSLNLLNTDYRLYANGRQALEEILKIERVKHVWIPSYYCHESITGVRRKGFEIVFYPCNPRSDIYQTIINITFEPGDALIVMNYFGMKKMPISLPDVIVIEDHSHDLTSKWALESNADWCFASLRKTLPIADGGICWSPARRKLPNQPNHSLKAVENSTRRYAAMQLKAEFLENKNISKDIYLQEFETTEGNLDLLPISSISETSKEILSSLDIEYWYSLKRRNWNQLKSCLKHKGLFEIFETEENNGTPFSLILLFKDQAVRDKTRMELIKANVYPAVLWNIPDGIDDNAKAIGSRMLSIHCDGRYSLHDIENLSDIINHIEV